MTKLLKLFSLICFIAVVTPSFAQLSVGNGNSALTPQQLELVKNSDLYLVIPNSQYYLTDKYTSLLNEIWTYGKVHVITHSDSSILETKKNISVAKIISNAEERTFYYTSSTIKGSAPVDRARKVIIYTLDLNFRYYNDFKPHKDDFTFANMKILAKYTKELYECKDNPSFKYYIDKKAKLKNFTPNFIGLTIKMINYNLSAHKVLNRQTQENIINTFTCFF